jgi:hypothetical protein
MSLSAIFPSGLFMETGNFYFLYPQIRELPGKLPGCYGTK